MFIKISKIALSDEWSIAKQRVSEMLNGVPAKIRATKQLNSLKWDGKQSLHTYCQLYKTLAASCDLLTTSQSTIFNFIRSLNGPLYERLSSKPGIYSSLQECIEDTLLHNEFIAAQQGRWCHYHQVNTDQNVDHVAAFMAFEIYQYKGVFVLLTVRFLEQKTTLASCFIGLMPIDYNLINLYSINNVSDIQI